MLKVKKVTSAEARKKFSDIAKWAHWKDTGVLITRHGVPYVGIVSPKDFEILREYKRLFRG